MPVKSQDCVIAVFEKQPYWGPELQRQFLHAAITVRECRTLADLIPSTEGFSRVLLVLDLDSKTMDCVNWLRDTVTTNTNRYPIIACGSLGTADLEWPLREIGVTAFLSDVISGDDFARLCRRQLGLAR